MVDLMLDSQSNDTQAERHSNTIKDFNTLKQDAKKMKFLLNRVRVNMFFNKQPSKVCTWLLSFLFRLIYFIAQPIL